MVKNIKLYSDDEEMKEKLEDFDSDNYLISDLLDKEGTGYEFINDENRSNFYPILLAIEESILLFYEKNSSFKDSQVIEILKRLRDNIYNSNFNFDELENKIIDKLKCVLFMNKYSKKDLLNSFSCLINSVKFHKFRSGSRGYLTFIEEMLGGGYVGNIENENNFDGEEDSLWEKGGFIQSVSPEEMEAKKRTIEMGHDEEMNYDCKVCGCKMSAHNKDWHDNMCDKCFNDKYYLEEAEIFITDLKEIKNMCKIDIEDNFEFKSFLKSGKLDNKRFVQIVKEVEEKIDCTKCGNCCKILKIPVSEQDIKKISDFLKLSIEEFVNSYIEKDNEGKRFLNKPCKFLEDNKCNIHKVRPEECRNYPNLDKDVTIRAKGFLANAEICPIVFNVLENSKEEFCEDIYGNFCEEGDDKND